MPNISRSKGNETMKNGQLIERNMRDLKNHTQNVMEKVVIDPFSEKLKLIISQDQWSEVFI